MILSTDSFKELFQIAFEIIQYCVNSYRMQTVKCYVKHRVQRGACIIIGRMLVQSERKKAGDEDLETTHVETL